MSLVRAEPATRADGADEMRESLFERVPWVYGLCREYLFRDDTDRIEAHLWATDGSPDAGLVIELGCGPGFYSRRLAARHPSVLAVGLDRSPAQVADARLRAARAGLDNCRFDIGDVAAMPFADASIDALVAARLFVVVEDRERVLVEMHRVLRPGGRAFISEPRSGIHARMTLALMHLADRLGGVVARPTLRRPDRVSVLDDAGFTALVDSQPWQRVTRWADGGYRYAVVEKAGGAA
jgi:ubiquinone/menaquinone biosynthesis C-methylase UbiE